MPHSPKKSCVPFFFPGLIEELREHADIELLARPTVTTIDNQSACFELGRRVPGVDSTVGLTLGLTPRVSDDGLVTMEIDLEKSEVVEGDAEQDAPTVEMMMAQTTVAGKSGPPVVLGGLSAESRAESSASAKQIILIATPRVVDGSPE